MSNGDWVFVPTASPYSRYIVQASLAGDPSNALALPSQVIMAGFHADRPDPGAAYSGCLYFETDTDGGSLFRCDGATWVQIAPGVASTLSAYKSADQTVTGSTTLQDDSALSILLAGSATYFFHAFIPWSVAGGAPGIRLALGGTVTVTSVRALIRAASIAQAGFDEVTGLGSPVGTDTGSADVALIEGSVETDAAGTLLLQWAQNTSDATNGTTVHRGAWLSATRG